MWTWLIAGCVMPGSAERGGPLPEAEIGARAVDFTIPGADGRDITLADYRGEVVVLDLSGFD